MRSGQNRVPKEGCGHIREAATPSNMTGDVNTPTSTPENATQQQEILLIDWLWEEKDRPHKWKWSPWTVNPFLNYTRQIIVRHISVWNHFEVTWQVRHEAENRFLHQRLPLFLVLAEVTMVIASINASMSPIMTLLSFDKSQTSRFRCPRVHRNTSAN